MPDASRRERVLDEVLSRLSAIEAGADYATSAGSSVHLGEAPVFGDESDPKEAIVVVVGEDEVKFHGNGLLLMLPLRIQAQVAVSRLELGTAYQYAEAIVADIKRAMELDDRTLGGTLNGFLERGPTRTIARDVGSEYVGVEIEYRAPMKEDWGNP